MAHGLHRGGRACRSAQGVDDVSGRSEPARPPHRSGDVASRRPADAQAPIERGRAARDPLAPLLPRPGGSRTCFPRTCRSRTSSTWPDTPTPAPRKSTTGAVGASLATSSTAEGGTLSHSEDSRGPRRTSPLGLDGGFANGTTLGILYLTLVFLRSAWEHSNSGWPGSRERWPCSESGGYCATCKYTSAGF